MEEDGKRIRVITVRYNTDIQHHEIPLFRGAVVASMGNDADLLYHNHIDNEKLRYSYPLIQYKRIGGKAAMVYINEACDNIKELLTFNDIKLQLGLKTISARIDKIETEEVKLTVDSNYTKYKIVSWVPFNSDNYKTFCILDSLVDKLEMLQNILQANILSMAKGLGIKIEDQVDAIITAYNPPREVNLKGVKMLTFNINFKSNVHLPANIGLGKSVSKGHGLITIE